MCIGFAVMEATAALRIPSTKFETVPFGTMRYHFDAMPSKVHLRKEFDSKIDPTCLFQQILVVMKRKQNFVSLDRLPPTKSNEI